MPRRIFIIGTSGSGKSRLARELSNKLGLFHIELDAISWLPDWRKRSPADFGKEFNQLTKTHPDVVIDGNFSASSEISLLPGDELIWLDYPRWFVTQRIIRRSIKRVTFRTKLWSGNQERLSFLLSTNAEINPVLWSWKSHRRRRDSYQKLIAKLDPSIRVHIVKTHRELKRFTQSFG